MRHAVFVDTTAWFALADPREADRESAVKTLRILREEGRTLVITNLVASETYTLIRSRLGARPGLKFLNDIRESGSVRRVHVPADWEVAAEEMLAQYDDQDFSYVDATSFVAMRRLRLTTAFAFDRHFVIAGFELFGAGG